MTVHEGAFLLPGDRIDRRTTSLGVYGADGLPLADTAIDTASWTTRPAHGAGTAKDAPYLFGPSLFAGSVDKQFGFVLLNSTGRLWALQDLPPETTVVFAAKPQAQRPTYGFVPVLLRGFGLSNPVVISEGPMWFEALHTAEERFGESRGGTGTPEFYQWLDRRWPADAPPDPTRRIYVTRSGLGFGAGRFACEDHLEALLAAEGYERYAPEVHPLAHQIKTYQTAGQLIFAEGSSLHLFSLLRRPGQVSAVILRRESLPEVMQRQMADRDGTPTVAINAVQALWWPPRRGEHLGLSVLDFDRLRDGLVGAGLISGHSWRAPSSEAVTASLTAGLLPGEQIMDKAGRTAWLDAQRKARRRG